MTPPPFVQSWYDSLKLSGPTAALVTTIVAAVLVLVVAVIALYIGRRIVKRILLPLIQHSRTVRDDIALEKKLFDRITLLVPALVVRFFIPIILNAYPQVESLAEKGINLYFIIVTVMVLNAFISTLHGIYQTLKVSSEIPLTGLFQVFKIVTYFAGAIMVVSIVFDRAPVYLFSGLGAMTAVLMLVFKDPILGFVAGIQLISNRMLRQGDWIEMPKYGADGDVTEISLTTVKVRNWDKTITTIPTYALISDSFKNWRGMQESAGRRIKRALNIDMNSIRFCDEQMLARYKEIRHISTYMQQKQTELARHNADLGIIGEDGANARRLTNIGTFRAYVQAYLRNHAMINQEMTFLVRQLAPTTHGLPLEIYVFCKDKAWANYEAIQSDIFDHLLAILPAFDLRVFQYPTGNDVTKLIENASTPAEKN